MNELGFQSFQERLEEHEAEHMNDLCAVCIFFVPVSIWRATRWLQNRPFVA
jgi:hypothetical protein